MRPDPGHDGRDRPDTPVSATAMLEVAEGLRELDPRLAAELARHAARLAKEDDEARDGSGRRAPDEWRPAVEVVERTVPVLRSALEDGGLEDEVRARCDLALAAVRSRAVALAAAVLAPVEDVDAAPPEWRDEVALRVAQVRAAEGDVDASDRAAAGVAAAGAAGRPLEADLEQARATARRRRGDAAGAAALLGALRPRSAHLADADGGRRAAVLAADHVTALVEAGALDEARIQAAPWASTPATAATALGIGRLGVVVAGRLRMSSTPQEAEALAGTAERDLADARHHREAAEAARVVAEAAERLRRWPEALAALRRARAHELRASEEERAVDRLLAQVVGFEEGLRAARKGATEGGAATVGPARESPSPLALVPELVPAVAPADTGSSDDRNGVGEVGERPARRGRRHRRVEDEVAASAGRAEVPGETAASAGPRGDGGRVGGRRRRREADDHHLEGHPSTGPVRGRHGRSEPDAADTEPSSAGPAPDTGSTGPAETLDPDAAAELSTTRSTEPDEVVVDGVRRPWDEVDAFSTAPEPTTTGGSRIGGHAGDGGVAGDGGDPAGADARAERDTDARAGTGARVPDGEPRSAERRSDDAAPDAGGSGTAAIPWSSAVPSTAVPSPGSSGGRRPDGLPDADELPLTLVGLLAEYDLPDVARPGAAGPPDASRERRAAPDAPPVVPQTRNGVPGAGSPGKDGAGSGVDGRGDGGARLADLLADAMDAFRRSAPATDSAPSEWRDGSTEARPRR